MLKYYMIFAIGSDPNPLVQPTTSKATLLDSVVTLGSATFQSMSRVGIFKEIQFIYLLRRPLDPQIGSDMTTQHELLLEGLMKLSEDVEGSKLLVQIDLK